MKKSLLITTFSIFNCLLFSQSSNKIEFGHPNFTDSSTIIIPIEYDTPFMSGSKSLSNHSYANIIFYNYKTDERKYLFDKNVYIASFNQRSFSYYDPKSKTTIGKKIILYSVKNVDYNQNGKIDENDPTLLYVSDLNGSNLKCISSTSENVASYELFEKQNFALIKVQRDQNNDKNFKSDDIDYYYIKLDLANLTLGNKIELK